MLCAKTLAALAALLLLCSPLPSCGDAPAAPPPVGGVSDSHGCVAGAGYLWCAKENKCERPWELAMRVNIDNTLETFKLYCDGKPVPKMKVDAHGCFVDKAQLWCEAEKRCVYGWELARSKGFPNTPTLIKEYCDTGVMPTPKPPTVGAKDSHGCIPSAGYQWCVAKGECVRPWELAASENFENTPSAFKAFCDATPAGTGPLIGGTADSHGCIASAGYMWCEKTAQCERPWMLAQSMNFPNTMDAFNQYCGNPAVPAGAAN